MGVALVAGLAVAAPACLPVKKAKAEVEEKLPPQVALYGVRLRSWEGSELVALGRAAKLTYDRQSTRFLASEGQLQFPSRPSQAEAARREATSDLEVRAPVVEGDMAGKLARGSGGVTVRSSSGLTGRTEAARFDGNEGVARSIDAVEADGPGYALTAGGFTFQFDRDELLFDGPVTSRLGEDAP